MIINYNNYQLRLNCELLLFSLLLMLLNYSLTSLQVLSISGNLLTSLPDEVTQLPWLQQLMCDNNQITSLPETIGRSKQLTKLYIHKNCLEALPEVHRGFP